MLLSRKFYKTALSFLDEIYNAENIHIFLVTIRLSQMHDTMRKYGDQDFSVADAVSLR